MLVIQRKPRAKNDRGFTLVEMLIVVVILAILTAIAVPAYISVVANSQDSATKQDLASVRSAEQIHQVTENVFASGAELTASKLLKVPTHVRVATNIDSTCYAAIARSDSGRLFWIDSWILSPREYKTSDTSDCAPFSDAASLSALAEDIDGAPDEPEAAENDASDFGWTIAAGSATVHSYSGTRTDVVIPSTYTTGGVTYNVTAIANNGFRGVPLDSVIIPDTVTFIGAYAFYQSGLTSATLSDSLTSVGAFSFRYNNLTSVVIPDSLTGVGNYAFSNNLLTSVTLSKLTIFGSYAFFGNSLKSITLPASVTNVGLRAFDSNPLTSVYLEGNAPAGVASGSFSLPAGNTVFHRSSATGFGGTWHGYTTATY